MRHTGFLNQLIERFGLPFLFDQFYGLKIDFNIPSTSAPMIEVFMYQAECGNAARIRFKGTDEKIHNIFVDGGVEPTYNHVLKDQIKEIISNEEDIDLFIVSHIHDDHIGGAISYLNDIGANRTTDIVKMWYYNPPRSLAQQTRSIAQGDQLFKYVTNTGTSQHGDITNETEEQNLFGLKINVCHQVPKN